MKQKTKKKKEWNGELTVPQEFAFQTDSRARVVEEESVSVIVGLAHMYIYILDFTFPRIATDIHCYLVNRHR